MKKTAFYTYLGTNGTITSPVHLEDIYYILSYRLEAATGKYLTKDNVSYVKEVMVPANELDLWTEVTKGKSK